MSITDEDLDTGRSLADAIGLDVDKVEKFLKSGKDTDRSAVNWTPMRKRGLTIAEWRMVYFDALDALGYADSPDFDDPAKQLGISVWEKRESAELQGLIDRAVYGNPVLGTVAVAGGFSAVTDLRQHPKQEGGLLV